MRPKRSTIMCSPVPRVNVCYCAGFWTPGCRDYPRALVAGVQKAPRHEIAGRMRGRCRGRYGDFAAGSGLLRLDCNGCRDRLAAKCGRIRRCERAIWTWRDGIGGGSAGESEVVMRAWALPSESRQEKRVSGWASIADDGIMTCRS